MSGALQGWATEDPAAAADYAFGLGDGSGDAAVTSVISRWAEQDPSAGLPPRGAGV